MDHPENYMDYESLFEEIPNDSAMINWFLSANRSPGNISIREWEWEELGPLITPPESDVSRALPKYALGRGTGTGRINNLYINPKHENQVFACSPTGGLFYSKNGGKSWKSAGTDKLSISGVSSVTINPRNRKNWVITTGDGDDRFMFSAGVYRTFDEGENWEAINGHLDFRLPVKEGVFSLYISEVTSHPCDFDKHYLACNKGLYKCGNISEEAAKIRWERVSDEQFFDIEVSSLNPSVVFAGGENLWVSKNCGKSWEKIEKPVLKDDDDFGLVRMSVECSIENPWLVYVVITRKKGLGQGNIGGAYLYSYDLEKGVWHEESSLKKAGNVIPTRARAFEKSPVNDSVILIGNVKPVRISRDFGETFTSVKANQMHDDIHDFEFFSDGKTVLASHDGGVSRSTDGGYTWESWDNGIGAANVHGLSVGQTAEPQVLYGAYDTGCYLYKEGAWKHVSFGDGFETVTHSKDASKMLVTMQNGTIFSSNDINPQGQKSTDETFKKSVRMRGMKSSWHTWIRSNPDKPEVIYQSGSKIIRSMDFGETWEVIFDPAVHLEEKGKAWRFYQTDGFPDHLFAVILGEKRELDRIYLSTNPNDSTGGNVKWTRLPKCPKNGWVGSILKSDSCATCHTISYNSFTKDKKVYFFDGTDYKDISFNLGYSAVRAGVRDKRTGRVYLGTKQGIFTKLDAENAWTLLTGLPGTRIRSMQINYIRGEVYIGTFGRGIWKGKLLN